MARKLTPRGPRSLGDAAESLVTALRDAGRLEPVDELRVAALRGLVEAVVAQPLNAALWRELRALELSLRAVPDDVAGDDLAALFAALGDVPQPGPPDSRG